jgi:hypothetical protein
MRTRIIGTWGRSSAGTEHFPTRGHRVQAVRCSRVATAADVRPRGWQTRRGLPKKPLENQATSKASGCLCATPDKRNDAPLGLISLARGALSDELLSQKHEHGTSNELTELLKRLRGG